MPTPICRRLNLGYDGDGNRLLNEDGDVALKAEEIAGE
jgi:hypothetical protein